MFCFDIFPFWWCFPLLCLSLPGFQKVIRESDIDHVGYHHMFFRTWYRRDISDNKVFVYIAAPSMILGIVDLTYQPILHSSNEHSNR